MPAKLFLIARREYLETVRTKAFLIGVLILPVLILVGVVFAGRLQDDIITGPREARHVAVINRDAGLAGELAASFDRHNSRNEGRQVIPHFVDDTEERAKQAVRDGEYDALLTVDPGVVEGDGRAHLYTLSSVDFSFRGHLGQIVNRAAANTRYRQAGLSPQQVRELSRSVPLEDVRLGEEGEGEHNRIAGVFLPFFFLMLIFFGVMSSSQGLLNSVIEEKNHRVIEVLLAAVDPLELMAGKIVGQSLIGLTLVGLYLAGGLVVAVAGGYGDLPGAVGAGEMAVFAAYYVLAFLLFNSLFAAVGSSFNSLKEAQGFVAPIMLVLVLPMMFWMVIVQQPESGLAVALSLLPPVSPMVMILRVTAMPSIPWLQVALSLALLAAAVAAVVWAATRVFRVGILMYGKPPGLREILRWLKEG